MKKYVLSFCLIIFFNFAYGQTKWDFSLYEKYTYVSFPKFKGVKSVIDINNLDSTLWAAAVFYATNRVRTKYSKKALKPLKTLNKAAQKHSTDMMRDNFFAHDNPIENTSHVDRIRLFVDESEKEKPIGGSGENIAKNFIYVGKTTYLEAAVNVVGQWMNSSGHRANILNNRYAYLGVGISLAKCENEYNSCYFFATQVFMMD